MTTNVQVLEFFEAFKQELQNTRRMFNEKFNLLLQGAYVTMINLQRAVDVATRQTDAIAANKALIETMFAELRANAGDPVEFERILSLFEANTIAIATAPIAGTPAAPPDVVVPPVVIPAEGASVGGATKLD